MRRLLALTACLLGACTSGQGTGVTVSGENYVISQLTASTWTATVAGPARALSTSALSRRELLGAIEKTSGCKVTDSDYSRQGQQLDAQVDCGGMNN
ncbi:MAG: hypothetical protein JWQ72_3982 [Polaromonas sp.]|nr:hypothetical protein [Polaromonas sp.]